ncbi:hypothetical protein BN2537_6981 [Streptomyces venezuelae]|nr:hypothetical protein BN2537_6981 [Streptomyces venezuelae]
MLRGPLRLISHQPPRGPHLIAWRVVRGPEPSPRLPRRGRTPTPQPLRTAPWPLHPVTRITALWGSAI